MKKGTRNTWVWATASSSLLSVSAHAGSFAEVLDGYTQNRMTLSSSAGRYVDKDPADRSAIQQYYSELETESLLLPLSNALSKNAAASNEMVKALQRAISSTGAIAMDVESCVGSQNLSVHQNVLNRTAKSVRDQLNARSMATRYVPPADVDTDAIINSYNAVSAQNWTERFLQCCKRKSVDELRRAGTTDRRQVQVEALSDANENEATELSRLSERGCNEAAQDVAKAQTKFVNQDFVPPSYALDPLDGLNLSSVELGHILRSSSTRGQLSRMRMNVGSSTRSMFAESAYFADFDDSCKKAKMKEMHRANGLLPTAAKTLLNMGVCTFLPMHSLENRSVSATQGFTMLADAMTLLGDKDLQCDPAFTNLVRSQLITDPNAIAQKYGIPQIQNPSWLQRARFMTPLPPSMLAHGPEGSVISPNGMIGGLPLNRVQFDSQMALQVVPFDASQRLGFLGNGPGGSTSYVRLSGSTPSMGRNLAATVQGIRSLANQVESGGSRMPQSAQALRQNTVQGRTLASTYVASAKSRGLAGLGQARSHSASVTRNLVNRTLTTKATRVSAEWIATVLRDRRGNSGGPDTVGMGPRPRVPAEDDPQQRILDEQFAANERRRQTQIAQANSMMTQIQDAITRSGVIVQEIQAKLQARDSMFNRTVQAMTRKSEKSRFVLFSSLLKHNWTHLSEIGTLMAEYDGLAAKVPMLYRSIDRLGGLNGQVATNLNNSGLSSVVMPTAGSEGRYNSNGTSLKTATFSPELPTVRGLSHDGQEVSLLDKWTIKLLMPVAWAAASESPGTLAYEQKWAAAADNFQKDWDLYLKKLRETEQDSRKKLYGRYVELSQKPEKLELVEPDAMAYSLMGETMEVIAEESRALLSNRKVESAGNLNRVKAYQDVEVALANADQTLNLLGEWGELYVRSAPKGYYDDPQVWESLVVDTILY